MINIYINILYLAQMYFVNLINTCQKDILSHMCIFIKTQGIKTLKNE